MELWYIHFIIYFFMRMGLIYPYYIDIIEGFDKFLILKFVSNCAGIVTMDIPSAYSQSIGNHGGMQFV